MGTREVYPNREGIQFERVRIPYGFSVYTWETASYTEIRGGFIA